MKNPFFSVIIPTYNYASLLPRTINSILQQSFSDFEIIIIDDGSTDNTGDVVRLFMRQHTNIQYFRQENSRQGAARNNGIKKANGSYIVFFDHDDLMLTNYLEVLYDKLNLLGKPNFIAAKFELLRNDKRYPSSLSKLKEGWYNLDLFLRGDPIACHFCIKKNNPHLFLFEEGREYFTMEDWMFLARNLAKDAIYVIDKVAILLNDHSDRSMKKNQRNIINSRLIATQWIVNQNILTHKQLKIVWGYTYYFCAIHSYLDYNRTISGQFILKALKMGVNIIKLLELFCKSVIIGRKNMERLQRFIK